MLLYTTPFQHLNVKVGVGERPFTLGRCPPRLGDTGLFWCTTVRCVRRENQPAFALKNFGGTRAGRDSEHSGYAYGRKGWGA
jgi:hypothetical protein